MVVFNIHFLLAILVLHIVFFFVANKETWSKVVRVILASSLLLIHVVQLSIEVRMGEAYFATVMFMIATVINLIITVELVRVE